MSRKDALIRLHKNLVAQRDALRKQLQNELGDSTPAAGGDVCDAAYDGAQIELSSQLAAIESRELHQIERAISRIREGRYGLCESCEARIPVARLKALPFTTYCIECQQKRERAGANDPDLHENWETVFEYEGSHSEKELTLGDLDVDLS